mmetsp:Transcript_29265/g.67373  ORF Transcript_29265/g.67373 Transcript_29265/m.67373 type:complete len:113 (+) Transcript_29265:1757-2095(+)
MAKYMENLQNHTLSPMGAPGSMTTVAIDIIEDTMDPFLRLLLTRASEDDLVLTDALEEFLVYSGLLRGKRSLLPSPSMLLPPPPANVHSNAGGMALHLADSVTHSPVCWCPA